MISLLKLSVRASLGLAVVTAAATAQATDYSDNPLAPTEIFADSLGNFTFSVNQAGVGGANPCTIGNCKDYVFFRVPTGRVFTGLRMDFYNSADDRAFVALQAGTQFTAVPNATTGALPGALAFNHNGWRGLCAVSYGVLRPASYNANYNCIQPDNLTPVPGRPTDLFSQVLATSPKVTGPLPPGAYSLWTQQVSGSSEYTLTAVTRQTPGPLPVVGALGAFAWSRRLRRRMGRG